MVRWISVLDVGDGACSVVREHGSEDGSNNRTAIIDCGSSSPGARSAARLLAQHLLPTDWHSLSELVVTHFDADHWEGLLRIVHSAPPDFSGVLAKLPVYFPAVPFYVDDRLPGSLMALITAAGPFGVQAMDLRAAWRSLTRLEFRPLAKGDCFRLAGRLHRVVWPPRDLDNRSTQRLNRLVQRIEAEAEHLATEGYPQLQQSLRETYQNGPYNRHPSELTVDDFRDFDEPGLEVEKEDVESQDPPREDASNLAIPPDWACRPAFTRLVKAARRAQNDLSLVFHDPEGASLLVFGDAPRRTVERVRGELSARRYQVALAPHHGSRKMPGNAPTAETCISQQGQRLHRHWHWHRDSHSNNDNCFNTPRDSDIVRSLR
jgi:hypothetical protein